MPIGPARMPLFDHLGELRMRLVRIVVCLFIGVLIFGESFSLRLFVGIVLILSAVILLVLSKKKKNVESHEERPLRAKRR